jgi:hypothetical protein
MEGGRIFFVALRKFALRRYVSDLENRFTEQGAARRAANPGVGVRPGDKEEVVSVAAGSADVSPKPMEKKYFHAEVGSSVHLLRSSHALSRGSLLMQD